MSRRVGSGQVQVSQQEEEIRYSRKGKRNKIQSPKERREADNGSIREGGKGAGEKRGHRGTKKCGTSESWWSADLREGSTAQTPSSPGKRVLGFLEVTRCSLLGSAFDPLLVAGNWFGTKNIGASREQKRKTKF